MDGCRTGWFAVSARWPDGGAGAERPSVSWSAFETIGGLLASEMGEAADLVLVDIPIGLSDGPPRACDRAARQRLGPRRGSVFTPPMRAMLAMPDRETASRYGKSIRKGGGVSTQSWNILRRIADADEAVGPALQDRLREGHPELAFARMGGAPMTDSKTSPAGRRARAAVLRAKGIEADPILLDAPRAYRGAVSADDVLDACVLAIAARDCLAGAAWVLGDGRDARGLRMEIVG